MPRRVNLDGRGQAVDGDVTTTGAVCIATGTGYTSDGREVLREGDPTTECPLCGQEGMVAEGVEFFISSGRRVAMDGALVVCACSPGSNRVVAPLNQAPPSRQAASPVAHAPAGHAESLVQPAMSAMPGSLELGFYVVPRHM